MIGLLPISLLVVATLGSIYAGIATATKAASVGGMGALLLMIINKNLSSTVIGIFSVIQNRKVLF